MKNRMKWLTIIAFVAIIGFGVTSCDNGNDKVNGDENTYLIMGNFTNQTAGVNATFYADTVSSRSARSAAEEQELIGKIEDGSIIFNLNGIYFPTDSSFILSAGSSFLVYEIAGKVTNIGLSQTKATVKLNNGTDWVTYEIPVTSANEVGITGSASSQQSNGLPNNWLGSWTLTQGESTSVFAITSFGMTNTFSDGISFLADVLEIEKVNDTKYNLIVQGEESEGGSDVDNNSYMVYNKIRLEQSSANILKLTLYNNASKKIEEAGSLAYVRAVNLDTADVMISVNLTR